MPKGLPAPPPIHNFCHSAKTRKSGGDGTSSGERWKPAAFSAASERLVASMPSLAATYGPDLPGARQRLPPPCPCHDGPNFRSYGLARARVGARDFFGRYLSKPADESILSFADHHVLDRRTSDPDRPLHTCFGAADTSSCRRFVPPHRLRHAPVTRCDAQDAHALNCRRCRN
jgi:hypothetical protein